MTACNVEVIKSVGRYYNAPVGTVCHNTEKVRFLYGTEYFLFHSVCNINQM